MTSSSSRSGGSGHRSRGTRHRSRSCRGSRPPPAPSGRDRAIGLGMALGMRLDGSPARVWVLLGDSEAAEGSVWEAMEAAAHHGVSNLTCVLDLNRLGQRGPTMHGWDAEVFTARAEAYGWRALAIDGHDVRAIDAAYRTAAEDDRPTMIVAKTEKGHGVAEVANRRRVAREGAAADPPSARSRSWGANDPSRSRRRRPSRGYGSTCARRPGARPAYTEPIATRKAFGEALRWLAGERDGLVVLDGEVGTPPTPRTSRPSLPNASSRCTSRSRR